MSQPPSEEARRVGIRKAAARAFVRRGLEATRLIDVAEEAGISKGGLYFHFPTKEALLDEIFEQHVLALRRRWSFVPTFADPADRVLRLLVFAHVRSIEDDVEETRLFQQLVTAAAREPACRARLEAVWEVLVGTYEAVFRRGVDEGLFATPSPREAATVIVALVQGLGQAAAGDPDGRCPMTWERVADVAERLALPVTRP